MELFTIKTIGHPGQRRSVNGKYNKSARMKYNFHPEIRLSPDSISLLSATFND
jgi:hypothetical protein